MLPFFVLLNLTPVIRGLGEAEVPAAPKGMRLDFLVRFSLLLVHARCLPFVGVQ